MKNLVIAVPSKGRLAGETFTLLKSVKDIDIYIYVHEYEYAAYKETYPDYNIVSHNKKTINEIRLFIQEHQHSLDNNMILLDDDIKCFKDINSYAISFNKIIEDLKLVTEYADFVYFYHGIGQGSIDEYNDIFTAASVVVMTPALYEKGVRYHVDVISEDYDFYIQVLLNDIDCLLLPFVIEKNVDAKLSHFDLAFRNSSNIEAYLKYGDVISLKQNYDEIYGNIAGSRIKHYKENGAVYSPESDAVLENIKINKFPGYELLEDWSPPAENTQSDTD